MRRVSTVWIGPMLLMATALISPSLMTSQTHSADPQEPTTLGKFFRIDQATGAPTALGSVKVKEQKAGPIRSQGVFKPHVQMVDFYVEGRASLVTFKTGEPQQFVIRLMSPGDRYGRELNSEEVQKHIGLTRLVMQSVKTHDERVLTTTNIPLDVQTSGQSTLGLDPQKPDRAAQTFRLTPQSALTPGEYLIWIKGTHNFELIANGLVGDENWAFRIEER